MLDSKKTKMLTALFVMTYMVSYLTRINFGAVISEIEADTQISRTLLSTAVTGSFITYGIGQIISGRCGDCFSPKKLVSLGLIVTSIMNLLIPICRSPYSMLIVWCINGFAQAFLWPPIVKLMVAAFSGEYYKKAAVRISWAASYGKIAIFFVSPILITLLSWKAVFVFSALCGAVMLIFWNKYCIDLKDINNNIAENSEQSNIHANSVLLWPVVIGIMVAVILLGMLRDGVTTWMPTYIATTYNLSNSIAILTGIALPIFSIICTKFTAHIYRKKLSSPVLCSAIMYAVSTAAAIGLYAFCSSNAALSVFFTALLIGAMYGVSSMLTTMVPEYFKKFGNISTVAGVINACTYLGSGISTYGIAVLSENYGWNFTIFVWCIIAVVGTAVCLACVKPWLSKFH